MPTRTLQHTAGYIRNALEGIELADTMGIDISDLPKEKKKLQRTRLRKAKQELERVLKDIEA